MAQTDILKARFADLWEQAVRHPFVLELGQGTLPRARFRRYFTQDYLFVDSLSRVCGLAIAKAPGLEHARPIHEFLGNLLGAEDAFFLRAFKELSVPEPEFRSAEPLPTTSAFDDFLIRLGYAGSFREICTALFVTEGVYLDWAARLQAGKASPEDPIYREWIEIHSEKALGPFVRFLQGVVDAGPDDPEATDRMSEAFETALRHEVKFWEMAYHGETWM